MLLHHLELLLALWLPAFAQRTTFEHAVAVLTGLLCAYGRRTVSRSLAFLGRASLPWAAHYHAFSRACWEPDELFMPIINAAKPFLPDLPFIPVAVDDTSLKKTGKHIKAARWLRDALSPPFHVNLRFGIRCLHSALLLPMHAAGLPPTAISLSFEPAPPLKKPPKKAPEEVHKEYRKEKKRFTLGAKAIERLSKLREWFDLAGLAEKVLLVVVDGGYTNRTVLTKLPERVNLIGRVRKDIAICRPAPEGGRKVYGERLPTPEEIRKSGEYEYETISIFYGGRWREVRYKEVDNILWQGGARRRPLRLFIIAPTPYKTPGGKRSYRHPAYLISTDLVSSVKDLIQAYFDRWEIEVLHRDLKTGLGLGQAQVWSDKAVARLHSALVAAYSMLKLAALYAYGPQRTAAFPPLPAWRAVNEDRPRRPSQQDLITMLRNDLVAAGLIDNSPAPEQAPEHPFLPIERNERGQIQSSWKLPPRETYAMA